MQLIESRDETIAPNLSIYFELFQENSVLKAIIVELDRNTINFPEVKGDIIKRGRFVFPPNQEEKIRICLAALRHIMAGEQDPWQLVADATFGKDPDAMSSEFIRHFFVPFHRYIIEKITKIDGLLYMLIRYKGYVEWYKKKEIYELYDGDTTHGEDNLDHNLREFLFLSGMDYPFSTPKSASGRTDILTIIDEKPIALEIKLFKGNNKEHIINGFEQTIIYANDYNSEVGYYVIYNVSEKNLTLELESSEFPLRVHHSGKTIYIILLDIYPHDSASQRDLDNYIITGPELKREF